MCSATAKQSNGTTNGGNDAKAAAPRILLAWNTLQASLPEIRLFGLNISLTLLSACVLTAVRYLAEYVMIAGWGWSNTYDTAVASSSIASIFHSSCLVPSLAACFWSHYYRPSESLKDEPVFYQQAATALLQFCTGYMIYDTVVNLAFTKSYMGSPWETMDYNFLGHHFMTIFYMTSCRVYQAGHQSAMICMFLGEMTNPIHNAYFFNEFALSQSCCNGDFSQAAFRAIELAFGLAYVMVRGLISPFYFVHATFCLWWRRNPVLPYWLIAIWTVLIWAVELGSIPYISECWGMVEKNLPESMVATLGTVMPLMSSSSSSGGEEL